MIYLFPKERGPFWREAAHHRPSTRKGRNPDVGGCFSRFVCFFWKERKTSGWKDQAGEAWLGARMEATFQGATAPGLPDSPSALGAGSFPQHCSTHLSRCSGGHTGTSASTGSGGPAASSAPAKKNHPPPKGCRESGTAGRGSPQVTPGLQRAPATGRRHTHTHICTHAHAHTPTHIYSHTHTRRYT